MTKHLPLVGWQKLNKDTRANEKRCVIFTCFSALFFCSVPCGFRLCSVLFLFLFLLCTLLFSFSGLLCSNFPLVSVIWPTYSLRVDTERNERKECAIEKPTDPGRRTQYSYLMQHPKLGSKSKNRNPKSQTRNPRSKIRNPKFKIRLWILDLGSWIFDFGTLCSSVAVLFVQIQIPRSKIQFFSFGAAWVRMGPGRFVFLDAAWVDPGRNALQSARAKWK